MEPLQNLPIQNLETLIASFTSMTEIHTLLFVASIADGIIISFDGVIVSVTLSFELRHYLVGTGLLFW